MKNNKVSIDLDLEDLLGLKENTNTLEYDLNFIIDNGIDKYLEKQQEEKTKDKEFMELFKRNYNDIVKFIEMDGRIAVNCYTCIKGMDLSKKYERLKEYL